MSRFGNLYPQYEIQPVGWVERSDTHHVAQTMSPIRSEVMGFASAQPILLASAPLERNQALGQSFRIR